MILERKKLIGLDVASYDDYAHQLTQLLKRPLPITTINLHHIAVSVAKPLEILEPAPPPQKAHLRAPATSERRPI
jgi:hypothetical protein